MAYIDYAKHEYDSAYRGFADVENRLGRDSEPGIEPAYYMAQIEYSRGDYENVISHGKSLLESRRAEELVPETQRIVGLSYFKLGDYDKAARYLSEYLRNPDYSPALTPCMLSA